MGLVNVFLTTIYSRSNQIIVNGRGLMNHTSSTQSIIVIPKLGSNTLHNVFTLTVQVAFGGNMYYSVVDSTLGVSL